eukprot:5681580-Alexandrium_andersonii.AAC.1
MAPDPCPELDLVPVGLTRRHPPGEGGGVGTRSGGKLATLRVCLAQGPAPAVDRPDLPVHK